MNNKALTVLQLNTYVKSLFDSDINLKSVFVQGELSNFTLHMKSMHAYFTLKDSDAAVKCVMFKDNMAKVKFIPKDGMRVIIHGRVSTFPRDGQYQLYADEIVPDGIGNVYLAFLQLKDKLEKEGLFDEDRKRPLPMFPRSIGVATSVTGAAVQDILNITERRFPLAEIKIFPCTVQGDTAAASVRKALKYFNENKNADVIIVARGGGSYEDLSAFNDEMLARDVAASKIPVVSAVGHETDFTIIDFVADKRAPTPSAAAEIVCPDMQQLAIYINGVYNGICTSLKRSVSEAKSRLTTSVYGIDMSKFLKEQRAFIDSLSETNDALINKIIDSKKTNLILQSEKIESMNPMRVLLRGYAVVSKNGQTVRSVKDVGNGDKLKIRLKDGVIDCAAEKAGN